MEKLIEIWNTIGQFQILENDLQNIVIFGTIIFLGILFKRFLSVRLSALFFRTLKKVSDDVPSTEFINLLKAPIEFLVSLILIYFAASFLHYPDSWHLASAKRFGLKMFISRTYGILVFVSIILIIHRVIDFFALVLRIRAQEHENRLQEQLVPFLKQLVKLIVTILFIFIMMGVIFKLNVGAIITGLGIGGVAVALAGKETLENLLASFSIFIDKPFIAGDLVKVGTIIGNVEQVGFRTSRIRTLDKSLVTIPNKQLIDQPLENLSFRKLHREKFTIGMPYSTKAEVLKLLTEKIKEEIMSNPLTSVQEPSVYFEGFGPYTLDIAVIFYAKAVHFEDFWKIKENINYRVMKAMEEFDTGLEYPTQVIHVKNPDNASR